MRCPSCKADIPGGSKFCLQCGAALLGGCPSCGNTNPAIAKFCLECGHRLPATSVDAVATPITDTATSLPSQLGSTERRYLTVMFCDLVGSTSISAQLDAEEWHDLVGAYLDAASAAVTEMGGHVAKKLGDGLMALFGYPVAQENDAERAARTALSIQRALAEVNRKNAAVGKPALNARIGIEIGPVVIDAAGEIYAMRRTSLRGHNRWPSRTRSWSRREYSAKSLDCLSSRSVAAITSKACPSR